MYISWCTSDIYCEVHHGKDRNPNRYHSYITKSTGIPINITRTSWKVQTFSRSSLVSAPSTRGGLAQSLQELLSSGAHNRHVELSGATNVQVCGEGVVAGTFVNHPGSVSVNDRHETACACHRSSTWKYHPSVLESSLAGRKFRELNTRLMTHALSATYRFSHFFCLGSTVKVFVSEARESNTPGNCAVLTCGSRTK